MKLVLAPETARKGENKIKENFKKNHQSGCLIHKLLFTEAVVQRCSLKKVLLETSENS